MATKQDRSRPQPTRIVHETYQQAVRARNQWIAVSTTPGGGQMMQEAHWQLHQTTLQYFEVMAHHLKTKQSLRPWWRGEVPNRFPNVPATDGKAFIREVPAQELVSEERLSELKQSDRVILTDVEEAGDQYAVVYVRYQFGLQHIDEQWDRQQERSTTSMGYLGVSQSSGLEPEQLPAQILMRVNRALDEAADAVNLLTKIEESRLPQDEI